jgi:copper chaperone
MRTTVKIEGMSCNHCVMAVTKALSAVEGIKDVQVDLDRGEATFEEGKPNQPHIVREAIEKAGFKLG